MEKQIALTALSLRFVANASGEEIGEGFDIAKLDADSAVLRYLYFRQVARGAPPLADRVPVSPQAALVYRLVGPVRRLAIELLPRGAERELPRRGPCGTSRQPQAPHHPQPPLVVIPWPDHGIHSASLAERPSEWILGSGAKDDGGGAAPRGCSRQVPTRPRGLDPAQPPNSSATVRMRITRRSFFTG